MNRTDSKKLIEDAKIDTIVILPSHSFIKDVKFYYIRNFGWAWKATRKDSPIDIYPMKNSHQVKCFTTIENAKRNFIRRYLDEDKN